MSLSSLRRLRVPGVLALLTLGIAACDLGGTSPTPAATLAPAPTATQQAAAPTTSAATQQAVAPTDTAAASTPVPTLTGDNQIDNTKLYHDSRDPQFRSPGGAVPAGSDVTLRLRTAPGDLTAAQVRIWDTRVETETLAPMHPTAPDMWEATVHTPAQAAALYYRFIGADGSSTAYYNDDKAQDGGVGAGEGYQTDTDYVITAYDPGFKTPDWLKGGVVYQIFPDRFNNGDPSNDKPAGSFIYGDKTESRKWGDAPTGGSDFFGGDLRGVIDKLDYLKSLGVTAIYFNPIFASPSNHRYDTTDYSKIDPALGDLDTFKELVSKAKAQGIHIILDGVFNHSSSDSVYLDKYSRYPTDGAYESKSSPYFSWYTFRDWPQKYNGWQN